MNTRPNYRAEVKTNAATRLPNAINNDLVTIRKCFWRYLSKNNNTCWTSTGKWTVAALTIDQKSVISSNSCVFVDLIQFHENWWVLVVQSFLWRKISLIKLIKTYRYFLFSLNCHLNKQFLSRSAVNWYRGASISFTEKTDNCIFEMSEKVFLLDTDLSSTFLLIILETVWAVRRYN